MMSVPVMSRRHEVRRELDARELEVEDARYRVHEQRLGEARHADDQGVAAGEQRDEHLLDDVVLADDELPELAEDLLVTGAEIVREGNVVRAGESDLFRCCSHVTSVGKRESGIGLRRLS